MNDLYEEELALEELKNLKAKTEMYKSASWMMSIFGASAIIFSVIAIIYFLTTVEAFMKIFG